MANHIVCPECGSKNISMTRDMRGLPQAICSDCGKFIKKMGASEVADLLEEFFEQTEEPSKKPPCRYCSEVYTMEQGRTLRNIPVDNIYCPMCGRKLTAEDKQFRKKL